MIINAVNTANTRLEGRSMNRKRWLTALMIAASAAFLLGGCGQRADGPAAGTATEAQTQKPEPATEAVVVVEQIEETEAPTEAVTEVATEAPTEAPTEPETKFAKNLTAEEEAQYESELTEEKIYYAKDDINIRSTPDTENSDNVISSYDQGERVTVVGETPNWFIIRKEDWTGYVYKDNLSETVVEEKTPEERSEAADQEAAAQAEANVGNETSVDYAESFAIQVNSDANVRAGASNQANIIGILNEGDVVTALGESDNWFQVEYQGNIGYVSKTVVG